MIQSVDRAIELLEAFLTGEQELGLTELATRTHMSKAAAFRLLSTLKARGLVQQEPRSARYSLGLRCWDLGLAAVSRRSLQAVAAPVLAELAAETGESAHLAVYAERGAVYTNLVESPQPVRAVTRIGDHAPAHCVATGKALLAHQPETTVRNYLAGGLPTVTPYTITDPAVLEHELAAIRRQGYAVSHGEWRVDVCGLAAPVYDHNGRVIAAIGISCPVNRFDPERLAPLVRAADRRISDQLGYRGPAGTSASAKR